MRYYFAPMEGLTDSVYRRLHHKYFPGVHRYYMPFFSPTAHRCLTAREERELPPADAESFTAIPQILVRNPEDFLWAAEQCRQRGYSEVNLNLGCPSGTVFSKGKGSGMLAHSQELRLFLDTVFSRTTVPVSVKTRLGVSDSSEFAGLLEIFNQYPIAELIIHPRVRTAFYKGNVDEDAFSMAMEVSQNPVCRNGNLCSREDIRSAEAQYPSLQAVMLGRGLIADPGMLSPDGTTREALEAFYDELLENYTALFGGSRNAMFRLKENWRYLLCRFDGVEKLGKRLRKTTDMEEYKVITHEIIRNCPMKVRLVPDW